MQVDLIAVRTLVHAIFVESVRRTAAALGSATRLPSAVLAVCWTKVPVPRQRRVNAHSVVRAAVRSAIQTLKSGKMVATTDKRLFVRVMQIIPTALDAAAVEPTMNAQPINSAW